MPDSRDGQSGDWATISEYLYFEREQPTGRKTPIVNVRSKSSGTILGRVMWFGRWRQFCFYPTEDTVFNVGCMNDIAYVIRDLHEERRKARSGASQPATAPAPGTAGADAGEITPRRGLR